MTDLLIRKACKEDIAEIQNLLRQVLMVHHVARPDIFKSGTQKYTEEELLEIINDDSKPVFVCVEGDTDSSAGSLSDCSCDVSGSKVLGHAFCIMQQHVNDNILTDIKTLYIDDICVDENCRGRHVGKKLYDYVLNYAKEQGCYNVTLNVWAANEGAMKFYEACGLVPQKVGMEKILQ